MVHFFTHLTVPCHWFLTPQQKTAGNTHVNGNPSSLKVWSFFFFHTNFCVKLPAGESLNKSNVKPKRMQRLVRKTESAYWSPYSDHRSPRWRLLTSFIQFSSLSLHSRRAKAGLTWYRHRYLLNPKLILTSPWVKATILCYWLGGILYSHVPFWRTNGSGKLPSYALSSATAWKH